MQIVTWLNEHDNWGLPAARAAEGEVVRLLSFVEAEGCAPSEILSAYLREQMPVKSLSLEEIVLYGPDDCMTENGKEEYAPGTLLPHGCLLIGHASDSDPLLLNLVSGEVLHFPAGHISLEGIHDPEAENEYREAPISNESLSNLAVGHWEDVESFDAWLINAFQAGDFSPLV